VFARSPNLQNATGVNDGHEESMDGLGFGSDGDTHYDTETDDEVDPPASKLVCARAPAANVFLRRIRLFLWIVMGSVQP